MHESRIRLSTGTRPSPQLDRLATSHPFIHQIDIVFPSRTVPDDTFTSLKTTYSTAQFTLSELYDYASNLAFPNVSFKALPVQSESDADDTWCIDPRGVLTLSVSKTLYEQLGIVGRKVSFKGCPERYVIDVSLKRETTHVGVLARQRTAMSVWDRAREERGLGKWQVAYVAPSESTPEAYVLNDVTPHIRHQTNVYVPRINDLAQSQSAEESSETHQERLYALFEWVGMACLGAQRLNADDRVDPYVAVYEAPSPSLIEDVTHIRWKGLMDSTFIRSVIDMATSTLSASSGDYDNRFISITMHSNLVVPVPYISGSTEAPLRVPDLEGEDTMCLILDRLTWAIGQSVGKWDARWG